MGMFEQWWKLRQKPAGDRTSAIAHAGTSANEDRVLVEYSEFVLVLSPEPLWQLWKTTRTPSDKE
jgi:hypothetical protein